MNFEIMTKMGFGKEVDLVKSGKCPKCETMIRTSEFSNVGSYREYKISGLCQKCQEKFFGE
jgi:hypothetical protein